nr:ribonuclease H-like domain-containing protein [Tanacetum cinerariifolium]
GNPQHALKDKKVIDRGCSRYMTGNMSYLSDFEELNGGYVAFGGNPKGGKISGKDYDFYEKTMAQTPARNYVQRGNHQQYARMTLPNPQRHVVPIAVLTTSKLVPIFAARPGTAAIPKPYVTRPRQAKTIVTKPPSLPRRNINCSPSPKASTFPLKVTAAKALMINVVKGN